MRTREHYGGLLRYLPPSKPPNSPEMEAPVAPNLFLGHLPQGDCFSCCRGQTSHIFRQIFESLIIRPYKELPTLFLRRFDI